MNEIENNVNEHDAAFDGAIRDNPTRAILAAVGVGIAIALVVRALQPRPVEQRAARLLEDLRERLQDLADPAYRRASRLASNGASVVQDGVDHLSGLHLDRAFNRFSSRLRNLFH